MRSFDAQTLPALNSSSAAGAQLFPDLNTLKLWFLGIAADLSRVLLLRCLDFVSLTLRRVIGSSSPVPKLAPLPLTAMLAGLRTLIHTRHGPD
jgi:hypothetical protein